MTGDGLCLCGCGGQTTRVKKSNRSNGDVRGTYRAFIRGHSTRPGAAHHNWKGGRHIRKQGGYVQITAGYGNRPKPEHVLVVERAMGKPLRNTAPVHHVDGDTAHNAAPNLVACDSHAYHMLLHKRQRARDACGNPNAYRCVHCHTYDRQDAIVVRLGGRSRAYHKDCAAARAREWRDKNPERLKELRDRDYRRNRDKYLARKREAYQQKKRESTP